MKQIFGRFPVQYARTTRGWLGLRKPKVHVIRDALSVREYFPNTFRTAYRQKSRWILGISLQGWGLMGWKGGLIAKYFFYRDRKALVTSFIAILGYFLLLNFLIFQAADTMGLWSVYYPTLFAPGSWTVALLKLNFLFLGVRALHRYYFVSRLYGMKHGLLSFPRMVVGNFVNAMAAARAWRLFLLNFIFGTPLVWDKTMHDFPSTELLSSQRQRLGEVLLSWQAVGENELEQALALQRATKRLLGEILIENNWVTDIVLQEAISFQQQWSEVPDADGSRNSTGALAAT